MKDTHKLVMAVLVLTGIGLAYYFYRNKYGNRAVWQGPLARPLTGGGYYIWPSQKERNRSSQLPIQGIFGGPTLPHGGGDIGELPFE
jgi:hypothetical protein